MDAIGESEIRNLRKRNPINRRTNNPLPTIPKKTPRITPKRINLQIKEAHRVTLTDLSDKLGKDGKLTQAERTRRFNNNLCLFCGGEGHTAKECPKSSSSATKAKADSAPVAEDTKKA